MSFKELGIRLDLLKSLDTLGFHIPMPIQEKAIPVLLSGKKDFVGLAQTGTGKTAAFGLPLLQLIKPELLLPQGIVVCPTRELCVQITEDLKKFAFHVSNINIVAVYGGTAILNQIMQLRKGAQIIVATPGRLIDLINRKAVNVSQASHVILDEADEMLNMGFQEDIDNILCKMPQNKNVWLFSATMPQEVAAIAQNYLSDPFNVTIGRQNQGPENLEHVSYLIHEKHRYESLKRIIDFAPGMFALVFCKTKIETQTIAESLMQDGYQAEALHGDLSQAQRDYVMKKFRHRAVQILVATDVAARGLDVHDITHVIHYSFPSDADIYTHRSGRTARAGKPGISITFITAKEKYRVRNLEKQRNIRFEVKYIPNGQDICRKQLIELVEKITHADSNSEEMKDYLPTVYDVLNKFDKEELIKRFVSFESNRLIDYYHNAMDINVKNTHKTKLNARTKSNNPPSATRAASKTCFKAKKTQRFFINIGRLDKINEGAIVRMICDNSGIRSNMIREVDLNREFSFFEVEKSVAGKVRDSFVNMRFDGRILEVKKVAKKENQHKNRKSIS